MAMKLLMFVMILCFAFGEVTISQKASRGISSEPIIFEVLVNSPCENYLAQALSSIQISRVQSNPTCLPVSPLDPKNDVNDYHAHVFCTNIDGGRRSLFRFHEIFVVNEDETPAPGSQFIVSWVVNRRFRENTSSYTYRRRPSCTIGNDVCSPTQIVNDCWDNSVDIDNGFVDSNDRIYFIPPGVTVATCTLNGGCCPYISLTNLGLCGGNAPNLCQGVVCNDNNACTTDTCDPNTGNCTYTAKSCSDGLYCTTDSCDVLTGQCSHAPITCDDGNTCTTDSCNEAASSYTCVNTPLVCNDNNPCTTDQCVNGACVYTPKTCAPTNFCDGDLPGTCNPADGTCIFSTPRDCNDNNVCTIGDFCDRNLGACSSTNYVACGPASDDCHYKICDPVQQCIELPLSCFDGDSCTKDSCDINTGTCLNTYFCKSSNPCITGLCTRQDCAVPANTSIPCPTDNGSQLNANYCTYTDLCTGGKTCSSALKCCVNPANPNVCAP